MNATARTPATDTDPAPRSMAEEPVRVHVVCETLDGGAALFEQLSELELPLRLDAVPLGALDAEPRADVIIAALPCSELAVRRLRVAALHFPYPEILLVGDGATAAERGRRAGYQLGAPRYVATAELAVALEEIVRCLVPLKRIAASLVGRMSLKDAQRVVRSVMVLAALSQGNGSRRLAARTLGVTRPAVQQMLAGFPTLRERRP